MKGPWLLDLNVLLAWLWPTHEAHQAAQLWMTAHRQEPWATCPLTEMGFLRIVTNKSFSPHAPGWAEAVKILSKHTQNSPHHQFWKDSLTLREIDRRLGTRIQGPSQIADAYLLCLARVNKGMLVTFDAKARALAPKSSADHDLLVILRV